MALDLGNPIDFARATLSGASTILQQFGRDPGEWDILEAGYISDATRGNTSEDSANYVLFHVFKSKSPYSAAVAQVSDQAGRRKAKYMFPYRDGQTTEDLGRKPETFQIQCLLHGPKYLDGFNRLLAELNKPTPGTLIHPVRGRVKVAFEDAQIIHTHEKTNAVEFQLTFIEHNFSIASSTREFQDRSVKSALADALAAFGKIDALIAKVQGAVIFINTLKNNINNLLNVFKGNYGRTLTGLNVTFNGGAGSADIPGLLPVNNGGTGTGTGDSGTVDQFPVSGSPSDPFANVPINQLSSTAVTALATEQLTKQVNQRREELDEIIQLLSVNGPDGSGALEFYDDILELKAIAITLQEVLERGVASSKSKVIEYRVPRIMSLREVAFANGLEVDRVVELDILNPTLDSTNYIAKDTLIKVPTE